MLISLPGAALKLNTDGSFDIATYARARPASEQLSLTKMELLLMEALLHILKKPTNNVHSKILGNPSTHQGPTLAVFSIKIMNQMTSNFHFSYLLQNFY